MHSGHFGPAPVSPCTQLAVISFAGTRRSQRGLSPSSAAVIPPNFGSASGRALETGVARSWWCGRKLSVKWYKNEISTWYIIWRNDWFRGLGRCRQLQIHLGFMCVCVCVCVYVHERKKEKKSFCAWNLASVSNTTFYKITSRIKGHFKAQSPSPLAPASPVV